MQVSSINEEVGVLDGRVTTLETGIQTTREDEELNAQVSTLENKMSGIGTKVNGLNGNVASI